ncbi:MAG TPA: dihydropteroate synthase, partial [Solirubrobacter sp.]|nr:dihydropteroate synthase [Solirubrobacter sp.]
MILRALGRRIELSRPLLMGILNATPDSFSDPEGDEPLAARIARGRELVAAGADILDVGGESARGDRPAVAASEEIARVERLIAALAGEALISVDTYKPAVAEAAIAAGAAIVNDVSGLRDPALAELCARTGAALVLMHTRVEPKGTLLDPGAYEDVVAFLRARIEDAVAAGMDAESLILDPGPDFAKTPAQSVAILRGL